MAKTWNDRVRNVYSSLDELTSYDGVKNIAKRCGYGLAEELWEDNPIIGGSINPNDFGFARL
jgi:hypothetical protein